MISLKNIRAIFKKEFLQLMRDKSVLFTNFFLPLFGLPLYLIVAVELASKLSHHETKAIKDTATVFRVTAQGDIPAALEKTFAEDKKIQYSKMTEGVAIEDINQYRDLYGRYTIAKNEWRKTRKQIAKEQLGIQKTGTELMALKTSLRQARAHIDERFKLEENQVHLAFYQKEDRTITVYNFYAEEKRLSRNAHAYVTKLIETFEEQTVEENKRQKQIGVHDWDPITVWDVDMDIGNSTMLKSLGVGLGGGILFLLLIAVFNPSINTTLGERDHHTYKLLLMNPVSPLEIFIGKYLNVALQGMLTLIPYAIEFFIFYAWGSSLTLFEYAPQLTMGKISVLLVGTMSVSVFVSALCFLVSSFAKTRQQAQSLMTLLMFGLMIPVASIGAMDVKINGLTAFLPLVNFPLITESLLLVRPAYGAMWLGILVNVACSLLVIWFSLGAFLVQWQGSADTKGLSDLLNLKRRKVRELVPAHAFMLFVLAFLGHVYGGVTISILQMDIFVYLFSPVLFSLGPALFISYYSGLDFLTLMRWRVPKALAALELLVSGVLLALGMQFLFLLLLPTELHAAPQIPVLFNGQGTMIQISYYLLLAIIPAISDEVLFRCMIYQSLRRQYPFMLAAVLSSLFFSIIYIVAFKQYYHFPLGILLAYQFEKKGIVAATTLHLGFNFTVVTLGLHPTLWATISSGGAFLLGAMMMIFVAISVMVSRHAGRAV